MMDEKWAWLSWGGIIVCLLLIAKEYLRPTYRRYCSWADKPPGNTEHLYDSSVYTTKPLEERIFFCSCGAACTKAEYEIHKLHGHDAGLNNPPSTVTHDIRELPHPGVCTRAPKHGGPCNGYPLITCPGYWNWYRKMKYGEWYLKPIIKEVHEEKEKRGINLTPEQYRDTFGDNTVLGDINKYGFKKGSCGNCSTAINLLKPGTPIEKNNKDEDILFCSENCRTMWKENTKNGN